MDPVSRKPSGVIHETQNEWYRKQLIAKDATIDLLKKEIYELEKAKYSAYIRISELTSSSAK